MKTILTIIALTTGLVAHAVTIPLIGLPLKPAAPKLAMKAAGAGKKVAAGMGFGAGVPYLCTGTKYECGLTGDANDNTPVVNADTGLRDIVKANSVYALDSSGNLYRRQKLEMSYRLQGTPGESVNVQYPTSLATQWDLTNICVSSVTPLDGMGGLFGGCTPPAVKTGNDWYMLDTAVLDIFGAESYHSKASGVLGYKKADGTRFANLTPHFGFARPVLTNSTSPIVHVLGGMGVYLRADGLLGQDLNRGYLCNIVRVNGYSSTIANCEDAFGTNILSGVNTTPTTTSLATDNLLLDIGGRPFAMGPLDGTRHATLKPILNSFAFMQFDKNLPNGLASAERLARNVGQTFIGAPGYTQVEAAGNTVQITIPGTGSLTRMYDGPSGIYNTYYIYAQTTTGETWRMVSDTGTWIQL